MSTNQHHVRHNNPTDRQHNGDESHYSSRNNSSRPSTPRTTYFQNNQDFRTSVGSNLTATANEFFPRNYSGRAGQSENEPQNANTQEGNSNNVSRTASYDNIPNERGSTFYPDNNWRSGGGKLGTILYETITFITFFYIFRSRKKQWQEHWCCAEAL
jgi:hypothetical protein